MIIDRYKGFEIRASSGRHTARPTCATLEAVVLAELMECTPLLGFGVSSLRKTWTMRSHAGHKRPIIVSDPYRGRGINWLREQIDLYVELRERLRPHVRTFLRALREEAANCGP